MSKDIIKIKQVLNVSPQETAIAPNLTVKENLEFLLKISEKIILIIQIGFKKEKIK